MLNPSLRKRDLHDSVGAIDALIQETIKFQSATDCKPYILAIIKIGIWVNKLFSILSRKNFFPDQINDQNTLLKPNIIEKTFKAFLK